MTIHELSREQLLQVKQSYLCDTRESVSYGELADADEMISDEAIAAEYAGTIFSEDDFS